MTTPILSATMWPTNAHMIEDAARIGYLDAGMVTLDATYGRGVWWRRWRPDILVTNNPDPAVDTDLHSDFRDMRAPDGTRLEDATFDAVTFDPPYVCTGGRETTTLPDFNDRYGLTTAPRTPRDLQRMNDEGLTEMFRIVRRGGTVLAKTKNYVWSARLNLGTFDTVETARHVGFRVRDVWHHTSVAGGPQPARTRADGIPSVQQHARQNLSTLLVLERP